MRANKKVLILAIILGLATVVGLSTYMKNSRTSAVGGEGYVEVVVAANTIPANVKITEEMLVSQSMPQDSAHPDANKSISEIVGGVSKMEILKGEQILSNKVALGESDEDLAYRIPDDMRAISIPTDEVVGVAGFITTGDKIDILVTYSSGDIAKVTTTYTQLQNIQVLAVGNAKQGDPASQTGLPSTLTLLVKPDQAEVLVYALSNGTINFALRNPADTKKIDSKSYSSENFGTYKER